MYEKSVNQLKQLKEMLVFQERRNFFNKINDKHLLASTKIVDTIIDKTNQCEFSHTDLSEVIIITIKIISLLDVSDEIKAHLKDMENSALELKEFSIC